MAYKIPSKKLKEKKRGMKIRDLSTIFQGKFQTKTKIYSKIDGKIYSWEKGKQFDTFQQENPKKIIKSEVYGKF